MAEDQKAYSARPTGQPPLLDLQDRRVPWITWAISGTAVAVTIAAGVVFLSPSAPLPNAPANDEPVLPTLPPTVERVEAPRDTPLKLSGKILKAQERATVWNSTAQLTAISLVIDHQRPSGPIEFKFGVPTGQSIPGAPIGSARYAVSFENDSIKVTESETPAPATALPVPNCPLDAALRAVKSTGVSAESRIGVLLIHSERHRRPVWLMTTSDGRAHHVNAENCVMLRR